MSWIKLPVVTNRSWRPHLRPMSGHSVRRWTTRRAMPSEPSTKFQIRRQSLGPLPHGEVHLRRAGNGCSPTQCGHALSARLAGSPSIARSNMAWIGCFATQFGLCRFNQIRRGMAKQASCPAQIRIPAGRHRPALLLRLVPSSPITPLCVCSAAGLIAGTVPTIGDAQDCPGMGKRDGRCRVAGNHDQTWGDTVRITGDQERRRHGLPLPSRFSGHKAALHSRPNRQSARCGSAARILARTDKPANAGIKNQDGGVAIVHRSAE